MIRLISTRPGTAFGPSRDDRPDGPVVMLNLLTFKDRADDPQGHPDAGISGREACARYERPFSETAGAARQAKPLCNGPVMRTLVGSDAEEDPDRMLILAYPSRQPLLAMMAIETCRDGLVHRYAAHERTILRQPPPVRGQQGDRTAAMQALRQGRRWTGRLRALEPPVMAAGVPTPSC
jgi:hypothetical protein